MAAMSVPSGMCLNGVSLSGELISEIWYFMDARIHHVAVFVSGVDS